MPSTRLDVRRRDGAQAHGRRLVPRRVGCCSCGQARAQGAVVARACRTSSRDAGTVAQQYPAAAPQAAPRRRRARPATPRPCSTRCSRGTATTTQTAADGTVDPGVATWDAFRAGGAKWRPRRSAPPPTGWPTRARSSAALTGYDQGSPYHCFDAAHLESFGAAARSAPPATGARPTPRSRLAKRFSTDDPAHWREPRRMYKVGAQGAALAARSAVLRPRHLRAVRRDRALSAHPGNEEGPAAAGLSRSRPISRILSWTAIHLCGLPGPRRAACKRSCLALHRVGFALTAASPRRRCALTAPFHPYRPATHVGRGRRRCHFCGTFPRVSPGRRYRPPCPSVSGLSSKGFTSAAAWPAPPAVGPRAPAAR